MSNTKQTNDADTQRNQLRNKGTKGQTTHVCVLSHAIKGRGVRPRVTKNDAVFALLTCEGPRSIETLLAVFIMFKNTLK